MIELRTEIEEEKVGRLSTYHAFSTHHNHCACENEANTVKFLRDLGEKNHTPKGQLLSRQKCVLIFGSDFRKK